jgi:hypothetical protein
LQKVAIVAFFQEDVLPVVAAIKDVVIPAILEGNWLGHGLSPQVDS